MKSLKTIVGVLLCVATTVFPACNGNNPDNPTTNTGSTTTNTGDDENDFVENQTWSQTVTIVWDGASATVQGATDSVQISSENGYVVVTSTAKHVEYMLSGSGTGQFKIYSNYKFKLNLSNLVLTCSNGAAVNNQCKKTCYTVLSGTNVLTDGSSYTASDESEKAAFFSEGQLIFSGTGSLTVTGNYKHALASDDYLRVREGTLSLTANASDGMHANDGIIIDGGTISIRAAGDGIQCDTSSIVITDGTVTIQSAGDKGMLAYSTIDVSGGTVVVKSTDKGIKALGNITISGGDISVIAGSSSSAYAPTIGPGGQGGPGGNNSSSAAEGIESKALLTISGGKVFVQASDDAINSGSDLTISGGYVCAYSTGNDGIDANGNCYIKGGVVYAIGTSSPEVAIDANSEERKQLYVQGGTLIAIGGLESGAGLSQSCYSASSWSKNTWYALTAGNSTFAFKTPASAGTQLVVSAASTPTLLSGVTVSNGTLIFNGMGYTDASVSGGSNVSLSNYSGNSGGRPGW